MDREVTSLGVAEEMIIPEIAVDADLARHLSRSVLIPIDIGAR